MHRTTIAIDGAAAGNPGPGGWALYKDDHHWMAGGEAGTTNNRMELTAAIEALRITEGPVLLLCDSRYVVDAATSWMAGWKRRGWRKPDGSSIANKDLIVLLDQLMSGRDVVFEWVRGHNGHELNEAADVRARAAAEAVRDGRQILTGVWGATA